jgi:uncharacterized protein
MLLNLAELPLRSGERYERVFPLELDPIVLGGIDHPVLVPGGVDVTVDRVIGGYLVGVTLDAKVYGVCARCLGEAVVQVHAEQQEFGPTAKGGWEESELSEFIEALVVDIDGLAREALILALPPQIVCADECRGLCAVCGKDLNKEPCGCSDDTIDQRWSRLKDLRLNGVDDGPDKNATP